MSRLLRLVPVELDADDSSLLAWLGSAVAARLPLAPVQEPALSLEPAWLDRGRRCSSNRLVDALVHLHPPAADGSPPPDWTLALTSADLFAPGRDFVFGEAARGGAWAVVSLARLRPSGLPEERALATLRARVLTEALHELGHLAAIDHCADPGCAMAYSANTNDIDHKRATFCPPCRANLANALDRPAPRG